jgi:hypothetical protein
LVSNKLQKRKCVIGRRNEGGKIRRQGIWNKEKEADKKRIWGNDRRKEAQQQRTGRVNLSPPAPPASSAKHAVRVVPRK